MEEEVWTSASVYMQPGFTLKLGVDETTAWRRSTTPASGSAAEGEPGAQRRGSGV